MVGTSTKLIIIPLNSFGSLRSAQNGTFQSVKLDDFVNYSQVLVLDGITYKLVSVNFHTGGPEGGHNYSQVVQEEGVWTEYNDDKVRKNMTFEPSMYAYILFYQKANANELNLVSSSNSNSNSNNNSNSNSNSNNSKVGHHRDSSNNKHENNSFDHRNSDVGDPSQQYDDFIPITIDDPQEQNDDVIKIVFLFPGIWDFDGI